MPDEPFQIPSPDDQREALQVVAGRSGRPAYLLEKDIWVVWTLRSLVSAPFGEDLTFKGGTSLSKAYHVIQRFSEDLDITYDIRDFAPDLVAGNEVGSEIPPTRSQEQLWSRQIRMRLARWANEQALPAVQTGFGEANLNARLRVDGHTVFITYDPLFQDYGFVKPEVMVEFGARATGEPREERPIEYDAADHLPGTGIIFPSALPHVMLAERTFWEKAMAGHVYCRQQRVRGERVSRHWHDLVRLDETEYGQRALADRNVAVSVARHKSMFFRENDADHNPIDYVAAVSGGLQLVPDEPSRSILADDYARMVQGGMFLDDPEEFDELMDRCADIQERANR